jgi:hypothetical protein
MHIYELLKLTNRARCGYILDPTFYSKISIFQNRLNHPHIKFTNFDRAHVRQTVDISTRQRWVVSCTSSRFDPCKGRKVGKAPEDRG